MVAAESLRRRCASYTRKSSEDGLEQDFNSLHAQREACEAYIRSQVGEGWELVGAHYDDGGCSGGTLARPALERLLADIAAGKIDTIVVYKVDRLTRSLTDFAKIVEVLDAHQASFVSVTQQFNTTTSMGRLTLNMLLSFAQFEREVTGERIRDKIAASKRRGLWMGGPVPLGYAPNGRTLVPVDDEAETIRTLFRLYLEQGSVRGVHEEAKRLGLATKVRGGTGRRMRGGRPLSRGHIHHLLTNPLYIGRVPHNGASYEGQHPAIVDPEIWDAVQKQLTAQGPGSRPRARASKPSPLRGKLFDEAGAPLTPSHSIKSGRRYRYYISRALVQGTAARAENGASRGWRLPALEIERIVGESVASLFANPAELARLAREAQIDEGRVPDLLERRWSEKPLDLVARVNLGAEEIAIHIDLSSLLGCAGAVVEHRVPTFMRRRGVERRLVLAGGQDAGRARVDPTLVKAVVRGRQWFEELASGRAQSIAEIARAEGVSPRYVGQLIPLAFLAPDIVASFLAGTQPVDLTTEALTKQLDLPLAWAEQRTLLGFD